MRQTGTVFRNAEGQLKVRVLRPSACENCGMCKGMELILDPPKGDWHEGDSVRIDMPTDKLLRASVMTYLIPLLLLIGGIVLGEPVGNALHTDTEMTGLILGLGGMVLSFLVLKLISPTLKRKGALDLDFTPCAKQIGNFKKP